MRPTPSDATPSSSRSTDAVPLSERFRVTQLLRAAAVALLLVCAALAPEALQPRLSEALTATLAYAVAVGAAEVLRRLVSRRAVAVFSGLLIVDGVWLAAAMHLTGGLQSPVRFAILLHLGAVALLASYRTCLKLALWHSLLMWVVFQAQQGSGGRDGVLAPTTPALEFGPSDGQQLAVLVTVLWLVAVSTSALSAINERELRRRRGDLEALTELAEALEKAADSGSVARSLLDSVVDSHGFARGLVLAGPDGQLPVLASYGLDDATARRPGRPGKSEVVEQAHRTHTTLLVEELLEEGDAWLTALLPSARNLVVVPLAAEGRSVGALVLEQGQHHGGRIQRRVVAGLERSASYGALALRNAWLLEQVQRLAATDGLTKIANRRTFESTLEREVARATRSGDHVSLVMIDIDHFKLLNDDHGHPAGDEVLRNVAFALSCECRDFDIAARYGGEEFAVVLPGCGPDEALTIADRLRRAVALAPAVVPVTASAGVATFPTHASDADALVRAADDALYESKRSGRDRTTASSGSRSETQVDALLRRAVSQRLGRGTQTTGSSSAGGQSSGSPMSGPPSSGPPSSGTSSSGPPTTEAADACAAPTPVPAVAPAVPHRTT
ncbi:MAG: diguanylate cyclase [Frankiales bacterium]|nr:diguanylate cyclase [Frankiales bacterium]